MSVEPADKTTATAHEACRCDAAVLARRCDPATLAFATTAELEPLDGVIGQARVLEAVRFGVGMAGEGFHLFVSGPTGIGKRTMLLELLGREATGRETPSAWCYVYNFEAAHRPSAIALPAGAARTLQEDMRTAVEELRTVLPASLESQEFQHQIEDIQEELKDKQEQAFSALSKEVESDGLRLVRTPGGFAFAPVGDGQVLTGEQLAALPEEEQKRLQQATEKAQSRLTDIVRRTIGWAKEARGRVKDASRALIRGAVAGIFEDLRASYSAYPKVATYLDAVAADIVEHPEVFASEGGEPMAVPAELSGISEKASLSRYEVNVLFDPGAEAGAPVIYEEHPTLANLVGHADYQSRFGALTTDFTQLKAGALHKANGGFLVLDVRKVLMQPFSYEALKRALHSREVRIESAGQMMAILSTVAPEPEPIQLNVKVVLVGDRMLYYLLHQLDPDFRQLFKVQADFDDDVERTAESERLYARLVAALAKSEDLRPFDAAAVARVVDRAGRLSDDSLKLSAHMGDIGDLVREADFLAGERSSTVVQGIDVDAAVDARHRRSGRIRELILEQIRRGTLMVVTEGRVVGQVNGLSVIAYGDTLLGQPARITATARMGNGQVVDIEREARLGGPTHSKGVLILSHVLAQRYARERPLALSASLVFEQSYGMVDGDSATLGELCALLSALADLPIDQSVAITGSMDQNGRAQAIGGVNEKIEGFFDACAQKGLSGRQGVIIPASNVPHLMLREEVVSAARAGNFHVWAVTSVDEAVEILTGVAAGQRGDDGGYPEGTINARVQLRVDNFFQRRLELTDRRGDGEPRLETHTEPTQPPPLPPLPGPEKGGEGP